MRASIRGVVAAALVAAVAGVTACTPLNLAPPDGATTTSEVPGTSRNRDPGFPPPTGSRLEPPGVVEPTPVEMSDVAGSLRPDDAPPAERVPGIVERGRLIVGVEQSQNRLSFRDPVTGQLQGFEVDLAHEIARDIFGDPMAVDFRFVSSADRATILNRREVDLVVTTLTITEDRQRQIQFSAPYLPVSTRMLVLGDSGVTGYDDLSGRTVCAADASTSLERVRELAPRSPILKVRRWSDCLLALQQRQVDAIITDDVILAGFADQDPFTTIVGDPVDSGAYGVGIRRSTPRDDASGLTRQVNSTLERMRGDGTWDALYDRWFEDTLSAGRMPPAHYRDEGAGDE